MKNTFSGRQYPPDLVPVGSIGKPHGLKGEMCVKLHDPTSRSMSAATRFVVIGDGVRLDRRALLRVKRSSAPIVVISVDGIETREAASTLRGCEVLLPRAALPPTDVDEYYDVDLIGMRVLDPVGDSLGVVEAVEHPPANDVLVIALEDGEYLDVPLVAGIVASIDLEHAVMTVDLPDGLPRRERR